MQAYVKKLFVFTIILSIVGVIAYFVFPKGYLSPALPYIYIFFFALAIITHNLLKNSAEQSNIKFVNRYLASTIGKMVLIMGILLVYAFSFPADAKAFIINFAILYLCYLGFNVAMLLKQKK